MKRGGGKNRTLEILESHHLSGKYIRFLYIRACSFRPSGFHSGFLSTGFDLFFCDWFFTRWVFVVTGWLINHWFFLLFLPTGFFLPYVTDKLHTFFNISLFDHGILINYSYTVACTSIYRNITQQPEFPMRKNFIHRYHYQ